MSGDYSRSRFDPRKHFTSVLMQQGRVQLDSDWNELAEALDRRFRAERSDTLFRAIVPRRTPDAFRVRFAGGAVTIGVGRMYVDGLMPENHGAATGPQVFDPVLYETRGRDPIDYQTGQPYFPAEVPNVPASAGFLVYLDTWQREVSFVEDPDIVEPAIGVDTSTRTQTAWRVRILEGVTAAPNPADFDPLLVRQPSDFDPLRHTPPDDWAAATRPPSGRLSTGTDDALGPVDNPCIIPPSGGYRGLENQLYRVEIHRSGAAGTALFKWSRDDASIAAQVTVAQKDALTVASVGRDDVLRFSAGDWVEIVDDLQEPDGVRSEAGVLRRVRRVDDEARLLELDPLAGSDLSISFPAATLTTRRTRVRRWDQRDKAGVLTVPNDGKALLLEQGVTITFSVDDPDDPRPFRAGDFWTFAARTEGAIIEPLTRAVPRGPHHHFAPLAWVDPNDGKVVDLRTLWPVQVDLPIGDCIHVRAESHNHPEGYSIQRAIDDLRDRGGGTVCLGPGVFFISDDALRIESHQHITLRGEGGHTVLIRQVSVAPPPANPGPRPGDVLVNLPPVQPAPGEDRLAIEFDAPPADTDVSGRSLLRIGCAADVRIEDLVFVGSAAAAAGAPLIRIWNSAGVTLERCFLLFAGHGIAHTPAIELAGALLGARLTDNVVLARAGIGVGERLLTDDLRITDNTFSCLDRGIDLHGLVVHQGLTRITGNSVSGGRNFGVRLGGLVHRGDTVSVADNSFDTAAIAIASHATHTTISGNRVRGPFNRQPLQPYRTTDGDIVGNDGLDSTGIGIYTPPHAPFVEGVVVRDNHVQGFAVGVAVRAATRGRVVIDGNTLSELQASGIVARFPARALLRADVEVTRNHLSEVFDDAAEATARIDGIEVFGGRDITVADNTLVRVGARNTASTVKLTVRAIATSLCQDVRISSNQVRDCGVRGDPTPVPDMIGITVGAVVNTITVAFNRVGYTDLDKLWTPRQALANDGVFFADEPVILVANDNITPYFMVSDDRIVVLPTQLRLIKIEHNTFEACFAHPLVVSEQSAILLGELASATIFTNNTLMYRVPATTDISSVANFARLFSVVACCGNLFLRSESGPLRARLDLSFANTRIAVNNVVQGTMIQNGNPLLDASAGNVTF